MAPMEILIRESGPTRACSETRTTVAAAVHRRRSAGGIATPMYARRHAGEGILTRLRNEMNLPPDMCRATVYHAPFARSRSSPTRSCKKINNRVKSELNPVLGIVRKTCQSATR